MTLHGTALDLSIALTPFLATLIYMYEYLSGTSGKEYIYRVGGYKNTVISMRVINAENCYFPVNGMPGKRPREVQA